MLRILVLGSPAVYFEDQSVRIQRRLLRNFLFYLASQPDGVSRPNLLFLFWENDNEKDARRRLRETLSKLRSQLPDPTSLITDQDIVYLDRNKVYVDLDEFKSLYLYSIHAASQFPRDSSLPVGITQSMDAAIKLWRAPQFLSGIDLYESIELERWLINTQEDLSQKRISLLVRMIDHHIASGNPHQAIDFIHHALLNNELDPDLNYRHIKCLMDLGRSTEALNRSKDLEKLYQTELSLDLPHAIKELQYKIKDQFSKPKKPSINEWTISIPTSSPLFGLEDELNQLKHCFQRGGVASVWGEAGSGKTRLIYELYHSLDPPPLLLSFSATSMGRSLPFYPLTKVLAENVSNRAVRIDPAGMNQLSQLMPYSFSGKSLPQTRIPSDFSENQVAVFETIHRLLSDLNCCQPLLFLIDNAHWLNESTLDTLGYLVEHDFFGNNRLLVLTIRPEVENLPLYRFQNDIRLSENASSIFIRRLNTRDIEEMTHYILGQVPSSKNVSDLHHLTGGNPYLLIESLWSILESSPFPDIDLEISKTPYSNSVKTLIQERLMGLTTETFHILGAAAVIGHEFTPGQLEKITGNQPEMIVAAIEELEKSQLIQVSGDHCSGGCYTFIHDITREALYADLSLARKRLFHLRAAQTLEQEDIPCEPSFLAQHYESAGELRKAFSYWVSAGKKASGYMALDQAYKAYQQAESLLKMMNFQVESQVLYHLYSNWGELACAVDDFPTMEKIYSRLAALGRERGDPLLIGSGLSGLAAAWTIDREIQEAIDLLNESIVLLEKSQNNYEIILAYSRLGLLLAMYNRYAEASEALLNALEAGSDQLDPRIIEAVVSTEYKLSYVEIMRGWPLIGEARAKNALAKSRQMGFTTSAINSTILLAVSHYYQGNYHKSLQFCQEVLLDMDTRIFWRTESQVRAIACSCEHACGRLEECFNHLKRIHQICQEHPLPQMIAEYHCLHGDILRTLYAYPEALNEYYKGLENIQTSYVSIDIMHRIGFILAVTHKLQEADEMIQEVIQLGQTGDAAITFLPAQLSRALILAESGKIREAQMCNEMAADEFSRRGMMYFFASSLWVGGKIEFLNHDYNQAQESAEKTIQISKDIGNIWLELRGHELNHDILKMRRNLPYHDLGRIHHLADLIGQQLKSKEFRLKYKNLRKNLIDSFN